MSTNTEHVTQFNEETPDKSILAQSFDQLALYADDRHRREFRQTLMEMLPHLPTAASNESIQKCLETDSATPLSVSDINAILWHAVRVSPMQWTEKFSSALDRVLVSMKTRYPQELLDQIQWLQTCYQNRSIQSMPKSLYLLCDVSDLPFSVGFESEKHSPVELARRYFLRPIQQRGWWFGLPEQWTLTDIPHIGKNKHILRIMLELQSPKQFVTEFVRCFDEFSRIEGFLEYILPDTQQNIRLELLMQCWDRIHEKDLPLFLKVLPLLDEDALQSIEKRITNYSQFKNVLLTFYTDNSDESIQFLKRHLDKITTKAQTLEVLSHFVFMGLENVLMRLVLHTVVNLPYEGLFSEVLDLLGSLSLDDIDPLIESITRRNPLLFETAFRQIPPEKRFMVLSRYSRLLAHLPEGFLTTTCGEALAFDLHSQLVRQRPKEAPVLSAAYSQDWQRQTVAQCIALLNPYCLSGQRMTYRQFLKFYQSDLWANPHNKRVFFIRVRSLLNCRINDEVKVLMGKLSELANPEELDAFISCCLDSEKILITGFDQDEEDYLKEFVLSAAQRTIELSENPPKIVKRKEFEKEFYYRQYIANSSLYALLTGRPHHRELHCNLGKDPWSYHIEILSFLQFHFNHEHVRLSPYGFTDLVVQALTTSPKEWSAPFSQVLEMVLPIECDEFEHDVMLALNQQLRFLLGCYKTQIINPEVDELEFRFPCVLADLPYNSKEEPTPALIKNLSTSIKWSNCSAYFDSTIEMIVKNDPSQFCVGMKRIGENERFSGLQRYIGLLKYLKTPIAMIALMEQFSYQEQLTFFPCHITYDSYMAEVHKAEKIPKHDRTVFRKLPPPEVLAKFRLKSSLANSVSETIVVTTMNQGGLIPYSIATSPGVGAPIIEEPVSAAEDDSASRSCTQMGHYY